MSRKFIIKHFCVAVFLSAIGFNITQIEWWVAMVALVAAVNIN